ncbi:DUF4199 domain-containing protein [Chitinophaga sp. CB10]|uniref:DUF4199 domain-containing protein n=1 Tax=Chitinophaga sp. CB10 TaxID=1891659 RepID=UPI0025BED999|nr:DUF4199 domain-containing protein [Chitinophaga sp. CB10]
MKKIVLTYGLIAGVIVSAWLSVNIWIFYRNGAPCQNGMVYGYASMIIAFAAVFLGIKRYRDQYQGGVITFGRAFKVGLLITLIACTLYVLVWEVLYHFYVPDFMEVYSKQYLEDMRASGESAAAIQAEAERMEQFSELYRNPLFRVLATYMEILPVGLAITLLSALVLKRRGV